MKTVAIFGVGLIGGSFALALRKAGFSGRILGVSSPATLQRALDLRVIDEGAPAREAAQASDLGAASGIGHRCREHKKYYCREGHKRHFAMPVLGRPPHGRARAARRGRG
jgi:2-polyprenyl-6-methoxyphenol hydroxylase-like FAD-dependent oxidoreductase